MEPIALSEVVQATGGKPGAGLALETRIEGVSTDSRTLQPGDLFLALRGENFDGQAYVASALGKGSPAAMVRQDWNPPEPGFESRLIRVEDPLKALGDLAGAYRRRFKVKVVGVTGTNGKTTTKEMIAAVLATRYRVLKSEGNLNNQIGVPLTLFRLGPEHEIAVTEFGMRAPGEVLHLCRIALPSLGVITNVGPAHLETMGTIERIADAKAELLHALNETGCGVVNGDDPLIMQRTKGIKAKVVTFGFGNACDLRPTNVLSLEDGAHGFEVGGITIKLSIPGRQNVANALAALAVGGVFEVPLPEAGKALEGLTAPKMRMEIIPTDRVLILNDSYNANPSSMAAAIDTLAELKAARRIAVLGDMLELGTISREAHLAVGRKLAQRNIDFLVAVGEKGREIASGARSSGLAEIKTCVTAQEAITALEKIIKPGDAVLVKGSRGMKMEQIVNGLKELLE